MMKGDIGKRSFEETVRICNERKIPKTEICAEMGIITSSIYHWKYGDVDPSAMILAELMKEGADMKYVLLGER